MTKPKIPAPPRGAKTGGARLWREVVAAYELDEHELALLREAVRTIDQLDELHAITQKEGLVVTGPHGQKQHPALTAAHQMRICLARIMAALRLPSGDEDDVGSGRRPQRRVGVRGVYTFGA